PGINYGYRVRARDVAGNLSDWSPIVRQSTQKLPAGNWTSPPANSTVPSPVHLAADYQAYGTGNTVTNVTWTSAGSSIATSTTTAIGGSYTLVSVPAGSQSVTASYDPDLTPQTLNTTVTAGAGATLNFQLTDQVKPSVPTNVTVTSQNPTAHNQKVTWSASTD